ncbi:MAG TPA: tetratricopeptide repeat protein [Thermodesulfobacteriota bacterium]
MEFFLYWLLFGVVWRAVLEYPYLVAAAILLWVFRDRIPNPARLLRRGARIRQLDALVALNPENADDRMELGELLVEAGRPREAAAHLEAAVRKAPDSPGAQFLLGLARLRAGDAAGAVPALEASARIDRTHRYGEVLLRLGEALAALGRGPEAEAALEEHLAINASSAEGLYRLAALRLSLGDRAGARKAVEELRSTISQSPRFRRRLDRPWLRRAERLDSRAAV